MTDKAELDTTSPFGSRNAKVFERLIWKMSDWRRLPQDWRRRLRKRFARRVTGPFDIIHRGMKFRLYPAENYCDRVLFGRNELPEEAEHHALLPYIKSGVVFVDIGANVGSYSTFVGTRAVGDLTLLAFEPHPRTIKKLCYNLEANDLPMDNVINAGVGPKKTVLDLWSDGGSNIGHTSMLKAGTANPKISHQVDVLPLIDVLKERNIRKIDLLKIDIEGFEDRALAPFFDKCAVDLYPTVILIEIAHQHLWERDLMEMLADRGYREVFKTQENRLMVRD